MSVTRDNIAGFMLGVSVGVGISFLLKPFEQLDSATDRGKRRPDRLSPHADFINPARRQAADRVEINRTAEGTGTQ
jgi:hypothetical protein